MNDTVKMAVVGAGSMGSGIAQVAAMAGLTVALADINDDQVRRGLDTIARNLERDVSKGRATAEQKQAVLARISGTVDMRAALADAAFVIEAAAEDLDIKKSIFGRLGELCSEDTVLGTNTSGLSITEIALGAKRPEQVIGIHFFNPAPVMQLVEIVNGAVTSTATLARAKALIERLGKTSVEVKEAPGFVVNRVLIPMINEAAFILMEGVASAEDIDQAMKLGANHPMGPLALGDLVGLDVCLKIMQTLHEEFGDPKYRPCPLLVKAVRAGRLGRKTGVGFHDYRNT